MNILNILSLLVGGLDNIVGLLSLEFWKIVRRVVCDRRSSEVFKGGESWHPTGNARNSDHGFANFFLVKGLSLCKGLLGVIFFFLGFWNAHPSDEAAP